MTVTERPIAERLGLYEATRRNGVEFLLAQMNQDGSIGPLEAGIYYYRVPWALAVSGETSAAMRVLEWVGRHMLTEEGEIRGNASPDRGMRSQANTYAETIIAYGAHLLGRFDIAQRTMRFALRSQDPSSGGAFQNRDQTGPDGPQLLFLTSQLGMSAILTGHINAALKVGTWFQRLWEAQPELPARLYTTWTTAGGLATEVPEGGNRMHYVQESQEERQYHYNGGISAAFLSRLYLQTGDPAWLNLARDYQRFSMESTERQFLTRQVCKSAWGAGLLSVITGEPLYRDWTARLGDWFTNGQEHDGSWVNTPYLSPNPTLANRIEITAEFVVHLDTVIGALGASTAH